MVAQVYVAGYNFVICEEIISAFIGTDHARMYGSDACLSASFACEVDR